MNRHPWQQRVSLLVLTTMLSACAGFGPDHKPATVLSPKELALSESDSRGPRAGWWRQLRDARLDTLIERALADAPSMQLARHRLDEARAAIGLTESQSGPQVDLNARADRERYSANGMYQAFGQQFGGLFINNYTLSLNAAWDLDLWGKNRAQARAALGQAQAAAFEEQQARLALTQAVIAQYTALQLQLQQQDINRTRIGLADSRIQLMRARVNAGLLSADSLHQVEQAVAALEAQNAAIHGNIQRARHALAALTGQQPGALDGFLPARLNDTPAPDAERLTANLLGRRPDIAGRRALVEAMSENVNAARADFYPDISITGLIGVNSVSYSNLFERSSRVLGIAPAVSLPIFHSGQLQSNLRIAQSRYDQAVDSYNQAVLDGLKDAADALSGQRQASAQLSQARQGYDASRKGADAMMLRLKAGLVGKLDVLDSLDNKLAQQSKQLDAQANARLAWASLNTAMGGGLIAGQAPR